MLPPWVGHSGEGYIKANTLGSNLQQISTKWNQTQLTRFDLVILASYLVVTNSRWKLVEQESKIVNLSTLSVWGKGGTGGQKQGSDYHKLIVTLNNNLQFYLKI